MTQSGGAPLPTMTVTEYWQAVEKLIKECDEKERNNAPGFTPEEIKNDEAYRLAKEVLLQMVQGGVQLETSWNLQKLGNTIIAARAKFKQPDQIPEVKGPASYALAVRYVELLEHFGNKQVKTTAKMLSSGLNNAMTQPKSGYQDAADSAKALKMAIQQYDERMGQEKAKSPTNSPVVSAPPALEPAERKSSDPPKDKVATQVEQYNQLVAGINQNVKIYAGIARSSGVAGISLLSEVKRDPEKPVELVSQPELEKLKTAMRGLEFKPDIERLRANLTEGLRSLYDVNPLESESIESNTVFEMLVKNGLLSSQGQERWNNRGYMVFEGAHRRFLVDILMSELEPRVKEIKSQLAELDALGRAIEQEQKMQVVGKPAETTNQAAAGVVSQNAEAASARAVFEDAAVKLAAGSDMDEGILLEFAERHHDNVAELKTMAGILVQLEDLKPGVPGSEVGLEELDNKNWNELNKNRKKPDASSNDSTLERLKKLIYDEATREVQQVLQSKNASFGYKQTLGAVLVDVHRALEANPSTNQQIADLEKSIKKIAGEPKSSKKLIGALKMACGYVSRDKKMYEEGLAMFKSGYTYGKHRLGTTLGWLRSHVQEQEGVAENSLVNFKKKK